MHSRGHRFGPAGPWVWSAAVERGEIHAVGRRSTGGAHPRARSQDIALHRDVGATSQESPHAQSDRRDSRYRAPRNTRRGDPGMTKPRDYESIPGTYVYDAERGRIGYALNMFCMSLNKAENRQRFKENAAPYLDRFALTSEQRRTVLERDWLGMLRVGGNIYYTIKIAFCDGLTFQDVAGMMSGVPKETYAQMMLAGGRSPEGNRFKDEIPPETDHG